MSIKKVELPSFDSDDSVVWITWAQKYFEDQNTSEEIKERLAKLSIEEATIHRFNLLRETEDNLTWEKLKRHLIKRYGGRQSLNPFEELMDRIMGIARDVEAEMNGSVDRIRGITRDVSRSRSREWKRNQNHGIGLIDNTGLGRGGIGLVIQSNDLQPPKVGRSIDPKFLVSNFPVIMGSLGLLIARKTILVAAAGRLCGVLVISAIRVGLSLAPGGEFTFVASREAINQPILVYMSQVDGKFNFIIQARYQKIGEKPILSFSTFIQAAGNYVFLVVPALLYAINNYLKFIMQLYFNPATVKMLSNRKVEVIAVLLKIIMKRRFSIFQWEALALLLIGISLNQVRPLPEGTTAIRLPVAMGAYIYTFIFVTVPSLASVFNEYALKSQYDKSIYLQNFFLYGYGAIFNFLGILGTVIIKGPEIFDILQGHSKATMLLIINNAGQGVLSSFFFKNADTILKKYSSTVATIFTGFASAALFGHTLTINVLLGLSIVFISMHQFFSLLTCFDARQYGTLLLVDLEDEYFEEKIQKMRNSYAINFQIAALRTRLLLKEGAMLGTWAGDPTH